MSALTEYDRQKQEATKAEEERIRKADEKRLGINGNKGKFRAVLKILFRPKKYAKNMNAGAGLVRVALYAFYKLVELITLICAILFLAVIPLQYCIPSVVPQLTAFDGKLAAESTALNTKNEDWTAQASNLAAVKTNLEAYKTQIADILKAAQEANKVDESLDYNKDGEINDLDQRAAQDATIAGSIRLDTYFDWVNKFVDYQMNNK